jgi:tetratricopeptide (TPR) repeat protein
VASQAHQLAYMLAFHQQDFSTALMHTKQAFQYGVIAEDFPLQTSALIRGGYVYHLVNDPESMLYMYQKAFQHREKVSPLFQGRTYVGLANAHALLKQKQEALHFLGLVHDTFPEHPEQDPAYAYTHWDSFTPALHEVVTYLQLNQPENAWKTCENITRLKALRAVDGVQLLTRQAETSLALGEMDQSCSYVALATTSALQLGSDLRYKEAHHVYQQMLLKWPQERQVKELAVHFQ